MNKGKLIVIEGLDGSGKSTQSKILLDRLNKLNQPSYLSIKPSQYLIGGLVRSRLSGDWKCSSECLQTLFFADHLFSIEKEIKPRLENGINVISDRYIHSTYAYGALDCDKDWLMNMNKIIQKPDLVIFLNVSVETCLKRIEKTRFSKELYEDKNKLETIKQNYIDSFTQIKNDREKLIDVISIDGDKPINEVADTVEKLALNLLLAEYDCDCIGM